MVTHAARERISFIAFTFTAPLFWYSFHFFPSELNISLYDVTHWSIEGLPCVAILFTTVSFPRSICKYCPTAFEPVDQQPALPILWILLRRACHASCRDAQDEDAFTASFGISLFSIPRGWMRHSVGRKTNSFSFKITRRKIFNQACKKTLRFYGAKKLCLDLNRIQIARSSELVRYISHLNWLKRKADLDRSVMWSKSLPYHSRGCFYKAWVGKCFPCKWYMVHVPCLLGAMRASYRLIHIVCLFGKSCCYGNPDRQYTARYNPQGAQRSPPWICGFEELVLARNKMPYMRSRLSSSTVRKLVTAKRQNSSLLKNRQEYTQVWDWHMYKFHWYLRQFF